MFENLLNNNILNCVIFQAEFQNTYFRLSPIKQNEHELPKSFSETRPDRRGIFKEEERTKPDCIRWVDKTEEVLQGAERTETTECSGGRV